MRWGAVRVWVVVAVAGGAVGEELPPLPKWSAGDFERLEEGRLVPGAEFFLSEENEGAGEGGQDDVGGEAGIVAGVVGREDGPEGDGEADPEALVVPLVGPPAPVEAAEEEFPTVIAERYRGAYFAERPDVYTIDPQELLSRQEFRDRESFLTYHARESTVDLYLYLFDAEQELPEGVSIRGVYEEHFAGSGPTVLVFYYLGMPERSQILLSEEIRVVATEDEELRALRTSVQKAFAKSDPADQVDSFLVELSIRTYWFEKAMLAQGVLAGGGGGEEEPEVVEAEAEAEAGWRSGLLEGPLRRRVIGVLLVGIAVGVGWIGRLVALRRTQHLFPEGECARLLGAPHAAGVGAVMSFRSADLPPSRQREQMPDQLQRM